jgi:ankyrin repeat protein
MVKSNVRTESNEGHIPPDLFRAARNNDIVELAAAIQDGQSLDEVQDEQSGLTPIHVACINQSVEFLRAAVQYKFDPWIRDANMRTPLDHARAQGLDKQIQMDIFKKMYPLGWEKDPVVEFP